MPNQSTDYAWADASAKSAVFYDQFFGPLFFEPYAVEVANRIEKGLNGTALEIAAGTGRVTRHLRQHIAPSATLIASDLSDEMLAEARKNLNDAGIEWQHIDAQQLPFNDNSVDLIVCCFGYMFVPDKPRAFAEAYRVLKPGAQFLFTTWDKLETNAISFITTSIAKEYLEAPPAPSDNMATSMWDDTIIQSLLQDAGFSKISIERVQQWSVSPTAKEAATGLVKGSPYYQQIRQRNLAWIDELKIKVENELAQKFGTAPMRAPLSALISQSWK